ncbi:hypothetical protein CABS01_08836, partial [Colletotrichum abscissum]|uniref:uncharacterized protein n=1 Tax=Colletotrichum abscissum TaxID=1671311 RepID=UPI0027D571BB
QRTNSIHGLIIIARCSLRSRHDDRSVHRLTLGPTPQLCETLRLGLKRIETCPTVTNPTLGVALVAKTRMAPGAGDSGMDHALFSDGTMESSKGVSVSISLKRTLIKFHVDRRQAVGVLPDCFLRIAVSASASASPLFPSPARRCWSRRCTVPDRRCCSLHLIRGRWRKGKAKKTAT